jgi:hypothetical protein
MGQARDGRGRFLAAEAASKVGALRLPSRAEQLSVQPRAVRKDGWTKERREGFLNVLAVTCNVSACRSVGMTPEGAYYQRRRDAAFRAAWREAVAHAYARLEVEMLERALIAEDRMRGAIAGAEDDREAIELLNRHPTRGAELLYRTHRQTALEEDGVAQDPDGEEALDEIRARVAQIRARIVAESDG